MIFKKLALLSIVLPIAVDAIESSSRVLKAPKEPKAPKAPKAPKGPKAPKAIKAIKAIKSEDPVDDACSLTENGMEVWKKKPNEEVKLKLTSSVDTDVCSYRLSLSWEPNPDYPLLGGPTTDDIKGLAANPDFQEICMTEGFLQGLGGPAPLSPENHVGLNEHYTDFAFGLDVPPKTQEKIGFKYASLGASPCGTWLQQFPQYSVHFYDITAEEREDLVCASNGDYFCLPIDQQCSEAARKFNMDGVGLPRCEDGTYQNLPEGYIWTIDGLPSPPNAPINAASPAMGLHSVDPAEFAPSRDQRIPYTLFLNYDKEIIGNHVLVWAGFSEGYGEDFTKETPNYNCKTEEKGYYPTQTKVQYVDGRTVVSIEGPINDCSGESFTEVVDSVKMTKKSKRA